MSDAKAALDARVLTVLGRGGEFTSAAVQAELGDPGGWGLTASAALARLKRVGRAASRAVPADGQWTRLWRAVPADQPARRTRRRRARKGGAGA